MHLVHISRRLIFKLGKALTLAEVQVFEYGNLKGSAVRESQYWCRVNLLLVQSRYERTQRPHDETQRENESAQHCQESRAAGHGRRPRTLSKALIGVETLIAVEASMTPRRLRNELLAHLLFVFRKASKKISGIVPRW